jgi:hypothetical protein
LTHNGQIGRTNTRPVMAFHDVGQPRFKAID